MHEFIILDGFAGVIITTFLRHSFRSVEAHQNFVTLFIIEKFK